jgi:hypothetical protein
LKLLKNEFQIAANESTVYLNRKRKKEPYDCFLPTSKQKNGIFHELTTKHTSDN